MKSGFLVLAVVMAMLIDRALREPVAAPKPADSMAAQASAHFQRSLERTRETLKAAGKRNAEAEY